ncbi:hypothetical protein Dimus_022554 [Dionaea muscipula]
MPRSTNNTPHQLPQRPPEIKQNDKFFSRLLAKEQNNNRAAESPSFRVYYGTATGSVPFMWESQPGTPKHTLAGTTLPPLSPPPSYNTKSHEKSSAKRRRSQVLKLLASFFPRQPLVRRNAHVTPTSPVSVFRSSLSSSSSSSSFSSRTGKPIFLRRRRRRFLLFSRTASPFHSEMSAAEEEEDVHHGSPTPALCFSGSGRGCGRMGSVKVALRSFVGQRSSHGVV